MFKCCAIIHYLFFHNLALHISKGHMKTSATTSENNSTHQSICPCFFLSAVSFQQKHMTLTAAYLVASVDKDTPPASADINPMHFWLKKVTHTLPTSWLNVHNMVVGMSSKCVEQLLSGRRNVAYRPFFAQSVSISSSLTSLSSSISSSTTSWRGLPCSTCSMSSAPNGAPSSSSKSSKSASLLGMFSESCMPSAPGSSAPSPISDMS
mmetsp:Transcript_95535/g.164776  ORF Transcript_95535/g.164776 Transcript_95535/m.164776 type:complete len:208 (-) Transcript_95535:1260-1883(-)